MLTWIIAFLGIALSFFVKYKNRAVKEREWSLGYWLQDNFIEVPISVISMVILLIIGQRTTFDQSIILEKLPWITSLPMDLIAAAVIGYLNNTLWYAFIRAGKKAVK